MISGLDCVQLQQSKWPTKECLEVVPINKNMLILYQMIITAEACWNDHQHLCSLSPGHTNRLHLSALLHLRGWVIWRGSVQWNRRVCEMAFGFATQAVLSASSLPLPANWKDEDTGQDWKALKMAKPHNGRDLNSWTWAWVTTPCRVLTPVPWALTVLD